MALTENCAMCKFSTMTLLQRYYNQDTDTWEEEFQHLACRRYPPTMVAEGEGSYPIMVLVHADEWCGEFKEIPSEPVDESYTKLRRQCGDPQPHPKHDWTVSQGKGMPYTNVECPGVERGR